MTSIYKVYSDVARALNRNVNNADRPVVCIQGLGFVGLAMGIAVAGAIDASGRSVFNVIGVDLPTREGQKRIDSINRGILPFNNSDKKMSSAFEKVWKAGNLLATGDPAVFALAAVTLVSINLDLEFERKKPVVRMDGFKKAIRTLGAYLPQGALIIVESTVPPGTCEKIVVPEIRSILKGRKLPDDAILIAHSYERVMPGENYLDSIINFWRVYSGYTEEAADKCKDFLSKVINVKDFPLTRLHSMTASETGKVLENSYRAVNIAFIEEWGRFAEAVGIDLFEVIDAIRKRPTHNNIKQPGFGVGGYCLTKDPLFAKVAARDLFNLKNNEFPFSEKAIAVNNSMPLVTLDSIVRHFNGDLNSKKIMLLGVSYRQDIGDARYSPARIFYEKAVQMGAVIVPCDPLLDYWPELHMRIYKDLPPPEGFDAVVLAVQHKEYQQLDFPVWLKENRPYIFDANAVLSSEQLRNLKKAGFEVGSIGRGLM
ncbi:MAG: nucleotide sugar dehydrogenase [Candidatus Aminicenantes bacterium]|nr:nucleotide sugar dehydrogenase [Candidatus Aminicenantes bacterium]